MSDTIDTQGGSKNELFQPSWTLTNHGPDACCDCSLTVQTPNGWNYSVVLVQEPNKPELVGEVKITNEKGESRPGLGSGDGISRFSAKPGNQFIEELRKVLREESLEGTSAELPHIPVAMVNEFFAVKRANLAARAEGGSRQNVRGPVDIPAIEIIEAIRTDLGLDAVRE